jgi:hypothetical protein
MNSIQQPVPNVLRICYKSGLAHPVIRVPEKVKEYGICTGFANQSEEMLEWSLISSIMQISSHTDNV